MWCDGSKCIFGAIVLVTDTTSLSCFSSSKLSLGSWQKLKHSLPQEQNHLLSAHWMINKKRTLIYKLTRFAIDRNSSRLSKSVDNLLRLYYIVQWYKCLLFRDILTMGQRDNTLTHLGAFQSFGQQTVLVLIHLLPSLLILDMPFAYKWWVNNFDGLCVKNREPIQRIWIIQPNTKYLMFLHLNYWAMW